MTLVISLSLSYDTRLLLRMQSYHISVTSHESNRIRETFHNVICNKTFTLLVVTFSSVQNISTISINHTMTLMSRFEMEKPREIVQIEWFDKLIFKMCECTCVYIIVLAKSKCSSFALRSIIGVQLCSINWLTPISGNRLLICLTSVETVEITDRGHVYIFKLIWLSLSNASMWPIETNMHVSFVIEQNKRHALYSSFITQKMLTQQTLVN